MKSTLISLSQIINFIISEYPDQKVSIKDLVKELELEYLQKSVKSLSGRLMFLLNLPEYQGQYEIQEGYVSNTPFSFNQDLNILNQEQLLQRKNTLLIKLGSEPKSAKWDNHWKELERIFPDIREQEQLLKGIYNACTFPEVRSRLQNKLIQLALNRPVIEFKTKFKCNECNKTFPTKAARKQHFRMKHKKV